MKRFIVFGILISALTLLTIDVAGVKQAYSEPATETKVDVYDQQKLVKSVLFAIGVNKYYVDGKPNGVVMDAKPFIQSGRTFMPIRYLSNALGVEDRNIFWDGSVKKVTLMARNRVEMTVENPAISVKAPGEERSSLKIIDVSPILKAEEGRTYLPARYIAEALGYEVSWDEATETVLCWPKGEVKPDVSAVIQKAVEERAKLEKPQEPEKPSEDGKPVVAKQLEQMFGVTMAEYGSSLTYQPPRQETMNKRDRSYYTLWYNPENGYIGVSVAWDLINSDTRTVSLDLSPIERVLNWKFPGQPEKVKEIMDYAWKVAEKTKEVWYQEKRLPNKTFYFDGHQVLVVSVGNAFVSVHISKN